MSNDKRVELQLLAADDNGAPRTAGNMSPPGTEVYYQGKMDLIHCIPSSSLS